MRIMVTISMTMMMMKIVMMTTTMRMRMTMTMMKIVMIAKLDSGRRFKVVHCPLQPDKDSKLRSNKDDEDDDDEDDDGGYEDANRIMIWKMYSMLSKWPFPKVQKCSTRTKHLNLIINSYLCEGSQMDAVEEKYKKTCPRQIQNSTQRNTKFNS